MDHIAIFKYTKIDYVSDLFLIQAQWKTEFSTGFLSVQMFYGLWSALAAKPHLTLY